MTMTGQQRKLLEKFAAGDRPLNRAIAASSRDVADLAERFRRMTIVLLDAREALADYGRWVEADGRPPEIEYSALIRDIDAATGVARPAPPSGEGGLF
jgi:hypothetical protein